MPLSCLPRRFDDDFLGVIDFIDNHPELPPVRLQHDDVDNRVRRPDLPRFAAGETSLNSRFR